MNPLIEFLIETKGVPERSVLLLLMLPLVATIISFWRQVIGLKTFGIYSPIVITFSFFQLGATATGFDFLQGLRYGVGLAIIVFISATLSHEFTRKIRLHYLPKMSIVLSLVAIGVFLMLYTASLLDKGGFISVDTLPLLLMITASEQMISIYIKKGKKTAYMLIFVTFALSILTYGLISWRTLQEFILKYPYAALLTIFINLIIGKWKGFQLKEYFRFKSILSKSESD